MYLNLKSTNVILNKMASWVKNIFMSKFPRVHISLYVKNIAETVNFYTSFFGISATKVKTDYAKYELTNPSLIISFVQNPEKVQHNFGHLGFQVKTKKELIKLLAYAKKQKISILEEMETNCCYAKQDKFWIEDPNGIQWEVYYFHEDVEFNDPHFTSKNKGITCCTPLNQELTKKEAKMKDTDLQTQKCEIDSGCC